MKKFNVTGPCAPEEDYMADISEKIAGIKKLIEDRSYFTVNKARQYGKTTILAALERSIKDEYIIASLSFEGLGEESFASAETFCQVFMQIVSKALRFASAEKAYMEK